MVHLHHFDLTSLFSGAAMYSAMAYAARTIPTPSNPWLQWLVGIFQFILSNADKGKAAINASSTGVIPQPPPAA